MCLIVGDFNVDFSRGGSLKDMLCCFMSGFSLFACELLYNVDHTYERDDGLVCSWIDHILCTQSFSHLVAEVHTLCSGSNLSDHHPLCFNLLADCTTAPHSPPPSNISNSDCILWAKVSASDIENYQNILGQRLSTFPADIFNCGTVDCSFHREFLEEYADQFVSTLTSCAVHCFPIRSSSSPTLVGWKDSCQDLKNEADFWYRVWEEAGRPSSGALFNIRTKAPRGNIRHLFVVLNGGTTIWFVRNLLNLFRREGRLVSGLRLKS